MALFAAYCGVGCVPVTGELAELGELAEPGALAGAAAPAALLPPPPPPPHADRATAAANETAVNAEIFLCFIILVLDFHVAVPLARP
ncbi:hypothetical protein [Paraburkholderia sp. 40]|uniref:hypothetical protein n=1 Tax=Paraburkholderia sp. 40 TaxID=2991059 RepID=UPI003D1FB58C